MAIPAADMLDAAKEAGLRYASDGRPGIRRQRHGRGFRYIDPDGKAINDARELMRMRRLAVPPAWTEVWVAVDARAHLQATGRDAKRRKQYRYHERFREARDEAKYERMIEFARALPKIRERVNADLGRTGLVKDKVVATIVRLLETTLVRVGNEEYAKDNDSFGLTTLRERHVRVDGSLVRFRFRGKSGKDHEVDTRDRRIARVITALQELPGQELFTYVDDEGEVRRIDSDDVNAYVREIADEDFTAKDFRTWAGTVLAARSLAATGPVESVRHARKNVTVAVAQVAARLGNTPAVSRKCYIHPAIIESYFDGELARILRKRADHEVGEDDLAGEEARVLRFLERRPAKAANSPRGARAA